MSKRPSKRNPLDETVVEELTDDGWKPFIPWLLSEDRDGEYTITFRVRTKKGPKRASDGAVAKLADELYEAYRFEPYPLSADSPYARLMAACKTRRR